MQSLTQKYLSVFEKSRKQIVMDGHSFVTAPLISPILHKPVCYVCIYTFRTINVWCTVLPLLLSINYRDAFHEALIFVE